MNLGPVWAIFRREISSYFLTPVAYVFIVVFLLLTGSFTFQIARFFERNSADLRDTFFTFLPWFFLFLVPAISMRLWAEERKSGTIELLLTLPVSMTEAVVGKFLAAWVFSAIALMLTFPLVITVNYLGDPDNGAILTGYLGALLMAGAYMAIGSCLSGITKNQVIAFILTLSVCLLFVLAGFILDIESLRAVLPGPILDFVVFASFLNRFDSMAKGVIDARDVIYFLSLTVCWLFANIVVLEIKKAQ